MSATEQNQVEDHLDELFRALDAHFQGFSDPLTAQLIALSCLAPLTGLSETEQRVRARAAQMFDALQPAAAQSGFLETLGTMPTKIDGGQRLFKLLLSEGEQPTPDLMSMISGALDPTSDLRVSWDGLLEDIVRRLKGDAAARNIAKLQEDVRVTQIAHVIAERAVQAERQKTPLAKAVDWLLSSSLIVVVVWLVYRFVISLGNR